MASTTGKEEEELLLPVLQQHPIHHHPLELLHFTNNSSISPRCRLCHRKISWTTTEVYTCNEGCETDIYYHRLCVEAPPQIDLQPKHPLRLLNDTSYLSCNSCYGMFDPSLSSFWCHVCDFHFDLARVLSTLSGGGNTLEEITLPLHPHPLTSFTKRHDLICDSDCYICKGNVEEDGYFCLLRDCKFIIHIECIRDVYYADGTKAPRVYHGHPMETFIEEDTGSSKRCSSCGSDKSGEFIGCTNCQVFCHRNCFQIPEILQYPPHHHPDLTLSLSPNTGSWRRCESCSMNMENEIHYRCTSCEFFIHVRCALHVLEYYEQGMSVKIELSWHGHPLFLSHLTESASEDCCYCGDESTGPTYVCKEEDCRFLLHKRCTEIKSTIAHPHHPDHSLTLFDRFEVNHEWCKACGQLDWGLRFTCDRCLVYLHVKCVGSFPTHKHNLHEHNLVDIGLSDMDCNRCGTSKDSPLFRCVPCDFNLHEECMELPKVIKNDKIHWHPLTLHDTFVEDNTGEYYCEHCEQTRDPRLGVYVCGYCEISMPRIYHIHCVLPELQNVYAKESQPSVAEKLGAEIDDKREEVRAIKEKLVEATQELNKLVYRLNTQPRSKR